MAVELVLRNGTAAENDGFTGALAEVTVDNTNKTLRVHDGSTTGGFSTVSASGTETLSNKTLEDPTFTGQITGDLVPSADVTYDLGSATNRWNDLFLSGNTIDIGGATISVVGGSFEFKDSGGNDAEVSLAANTTDDLSEGSTNLYYTDARVDAHLSGGSGIDFSSGTISHSDTSSVSSVSATSNTFIDAITFDTFGHVTAVSTSTAAPPNDATITVSAGTGLTGGGNFTTDQSGNETISLDIDTSTIATRSYVDTEVANLVDSSPSTLDTLNELAAALGDDPNFATTVANDIGDKADKTVDINAGSGLTGGGDLSASRTISHADTSSQGSVNNSGSTFIQDITLDGFGHITNINSSTVSGFVQENTAVTFTTVTANDFNSTSDIRKKKNIETLDSALDKTLSLRGVSFTHNDTGTNSIGVIAQEIEEVIPEVVSTDSDGIKSVSYGNIVGLLIEAIKEQQNEIDELKAKVYK